MDRRDSTARTVLALALSIAFCVLPLWSLIWKGPFRWHVAQPSFYQGMVEITLLGCIAYLAARWQRAGAWLLLACASALYARRHGVDLSIIVVLLYLEGIYSLGSVLTSSFVRKRHGGEGLDLWLTKAALGVTAWLLIVWLHSLFGLNRVASVSVVAICILGLAIVLNRSPGVASSAAKQLQRVSTESPVVLAIYVACFFGAFAKAAVAVDYDSAWYGLQLTTSLAPDGSLFSPTGLSAPVHYYPKLFESLLLPLVPTGSTASIYGIGIFCVFLTGLLVPHIWERIVATRSSAPSWLILLPLLIPAFTSISLTAKGDAFATCCFFVAVLAGLLSWTEKSRSWALLGLSAAGYAALSRLATLPYVALAAIALLLLFFANVRRKETSPYSGVRILVFACSALVMLLVLYRSVKLSGVALVSPPQLLPLQSLLGLDLEYPVGLVPTEGTEHIPIFPGFFNYLFRPDRYSLLLTTWSGNFWALIFLFSLLLGKSKVKAKPFASLLIIGLSGLTVLFSFGFRPGMGADGNYFLIPFLCLAVAGAALTTPQRIVTVLICVGAVSTFSIAILTGSWTPGTQSFDGNFRRSNNQLDTYRSQAVSHVGYEGVERFLRSQVRSTRTIGFDPTHSLTAPPGWFLSTRYEPLEVLSWSQPGVMNDLDSLMTFARAARIDYVLVPKPGYISQPSSDAALRADLLLHDARAANQADIAYEDDRAAIWRLKYTQLSTRLSMGSGVFAETSIDDQYQCSTAQNYPVNLRWANVPVNAPLSVKVKAITQPTSSLWTQVSGSGKEATGPWMSDGATMELSQKGKLVGSFSIYRHCQQ